jgi:hypothetical protein
MYIRAENGRMYGPMTAKRMVRIAKPINWIGLRPHESMKRKDTQYPGIKPATERIRLPTQTLCKFSYT